VQARLATLVSVAPLDSQGQSASKVSRDDQASLDGLVQEVAQEELVPSGSPDYAVLPEIQVIIHSGYFSNN